MRTTKQQSHSQRQNTDSHIPFFYVRVIFVKFINEVNFTVKAFHVIGKYFFMIEYKIYISYKDTQSNKSESFESNIILQQVMLCLMVEIHMMTFSYIIAHCYYFRVYSNSKNMCFIYTIEHNFTNNSTNNNNRIELR